jgi:hypothetical protein
MLNLDTYLQKVLGLGYRSSAISPLLWLNALIGVPCVVSSFMIQSNFRWAPFLPGTGIAIYTCYSYRHLINIDPRLVQSEKFQIEMQKLDIIGEKGGPIIFDTVNIPLAEDPKQLPESRDEDL